MVNYPYYKKLLIWEALTLKKTAFKFTILSLILSMVLLSVSSCVGIKEKGSVSEYESDTKPAQTENLPEQTTAPVQTEPETEPVNAPVKTGTVSRPADLSFLNGLSKGFFSDADQTSGSWYPGKTVRDLATGEVTVSWDRAADTMAALEKYGAIYRKNADQKVCYFTFDCGYENGVTPKILDVLKSKNVKGVFFVTGAYIKSAPELIQRMYDEGHVVGTHTNNHKNMALLSAEEFVEEIMSNEELLKAAIPGAPDMAYYRPPEGACSEWALALAQKMGLTTTLWSWTQFDYDVNKQPEPAAALENAKKGLHDGCVYLLHAVSETNAAILGDLIDFIRAQGYEIRPINQ